VTLGQAGRDIMLESCLKLTSRPAPATGYHPSVDLLFSSAASIFRSSAVAVVLSGAGTDGAEGAVLVADAGGVVLTQDEKSSVVYGMPRAVNESRVPTVTGSPQMLSRLVLEAVRKRSSSSSFFS
jgi:two-component system chemotaxis response regulator CheB